jgi:hypothetical protein
MANPTLFVSSCVVSVIHVVFMCMYWSCIPGVLLWLWALGLATSVWNHGVTCALAKWGDRVIMAVATGVDLFYAPDKRCSCLVLSAVASYLSGKHVSGQTGLLLHVGLMLHAGSHALITAAHVLMMVSCSSWML